VTFVPSFTFDGEQFDGVSAYQRVDGEELVFLPKLDRWIWFDRATGVDDKPVGDLRPRFRETMGNLAITGTFIF